MKKCPTCGKEFEDSMRFCQIDGAVLEDAPAAEEAAFDPYATIVSPAIQVPEEHAVEAAPLEEATSEAPPDEEPVLVAGQSIPPAPIAAPDVELELPGTDPLKTVFVSDEEMKAAMQDSVPEPDVADVPPAAAEPPPSPFSVPEPPAPSFIEPEPEPVLPPIAEEPETIIQPPPPAAFEPPPAPVEQWTPPPPPEVAWQNQEIGSNTPFNPPPLGTAVGDQNKTLPIVSLILGIGSLCCYLAPITGIAALITGFLGMKNANNNPAEYGGKGLAIAGMVLGALFFLIGIVYYIFIIFFNGMAMLLGASR
ncbi:MAG: DUF4190 domain-containing protein [Chloracidobacterium sp.]|nr:DUF4190 domain-containing protein [Chloracidobacterium sp.]